MFGGEDQQSPEGGGITTAGEPIDAIRERLADGETVVHRLAGSGPLGYEPAEADGSRQSSAGDGLLVATDRRLHLAAETDDGLGVHTVPYRDVRTVTARDGLIRSRIAIRVWNDGTYRLPTARGQDVSGAAAFVEEASETVQRVLAALDDARDRITELGKQLEAGDRADVAASHEAVGDDLALARRRLEAGPDALAATLEDRVTKVATELQRTRMRAHLARGSTLVDEGDRLTDREAWDQAVAAYVGAREHFETASDISRTQDFGLRGPIQAEVERLERRTAMLEDLPLQLAEDARAAAQAAADPGDAVPAWAAAFEHYRAALTAGWGTAVDFAGDEQSLRLQVEWVAAKLIDGRRDLAARLRREGDDRRMAGEDDAAGDRYEAALSQLEAADRVARELRAGDPDAIADQREALRRRLRAARAGRPTSTTDEGAGPPPTDDRPVPEAGPGEDTTDRKTPVEPGPG